MAESKRGSTGRAAGSGTGMRADAALNRERILAAAREVFREQGTSARLEQIAARAGVGIGTLYRRFPDREALIRQVVVEGFAFALAASERALGSRTGTTDALSAIGGLFQEVVEQRERLVLPLIGGPLVPDDEVRALQRGIFAALDALLAAGRADGTVRADVTPVDLIAAAAMASRPFPHLPKELGEAMAARHLTVYLHGLGPGGAGPLPRPAVDTDELGRHVAGE